MSLEMIGYFAIFSNNGEILLEKGVSEIGDPLWELPTQDLKAAHTVTNFFVDDNNGKEVVFRYLCRLNKTQDSSVEYTNRKWFYPDSLPPLEPISKSFVEDLHLR